MVSPAAMIEMIRKADTITVNYQLSTINYPLAKELLWNINA